MGDSNPSAEQRWDHVRALMEAETVAFTGETAKLFRRNPHEVLASLNRYKFAAKLLGRRHVVEVGCGEGLGTWLLAKECGSAHGLSEFEPASVLNARWNSPLVSFAPLSQEVEPGDALVCFRPALLEWPSDLRRVGPGGVAVLALPQAPQDAAAWAELLNASFDHVFFFEAAACPIRPWGAPPPGSIALACNPRAQT